MAKTPQRQRQFMPIMVCIAVPSPLIQNAMQAASISLAPSISAI